MGKAQSRLGVALVKALWLMHTQPETPPDVQKALERLPDTAWTVVPGLCSNDMIVSETMIEIGGVQRIARRTQYVADELLQAANLEEFNDSAGKRWGSGRIAARLPLNKWLSEFAPRLREGDHDFSKWWLNRSDNQPFRTFKGKV